VINMIRQARLALGAAGCGADGAVRLSTRSLRRRSRTANRLRARVLRCRRW
jgi:hypothetical protein